MKPWQSGILVVIVVMVSQLITDWNISGRLIDFQIVKDDTEKESTILRNQTTQPSSLSPSTPTNRTSTSSSSKIRINPLSDDISSTTHPNETRETVLYPKLRLCRFSPMPQRGMPPIQIATEKMVMGYQCEGPAYDKCAKAARSIARHRPRHWSQVGVPVAPSNSTILFLGNSHVGQIFHAIICQYREEVIQFNWNSVTLKNGITLLSSTNEAWHFDVLTRANFSYGFEQRFHKPIHSITAIIVGDFNGQDIHWDFEKLASTRKENFYKDMIEQAKRDGLTLKGPMKLSHLARHFQGPIIRTTNWDIEGKRLSNLHQQIQKIIPHRDNIVVLSGGRYIPDIGYCSHEKHYTEVVDAVEKPSFHRCLGGKGGHPDLMAWDVVETLGKLL